MHTILREHWVLKEYINIKQREILIITMTAAGVKRLGDNIQALLRGVDPYDGKGFYGYNYEEDMITYQSGPASVDTEYSYDYVMQALKDIILKGG